MSDDPFVGAWVLDPDGSDYELGDPPQAGLYTINATATGYHIRMQWTDTSGQAFDMDYDALPDGIDHPYENPEIAESISMTRVDHHTLESATKKGGEVIAHARRTLNKTEDTMTVVQSGPTLDGGRFHNTSVYRRAP